MRLSALVALVTVLVPAAAAQGPQYRARTGTFALTGCRIETVTNGTIANGTLVIRDGRIAALGADTAVPADAEPVPCNGGTVYPGLFDSGDRVGLQEIGAVAVTTDLDEVGEVTPQMRALTAVNPSSVHIPVTRLSGVTTVLTVPRGGMMPGTAALITLLGYTPDEMAAGFEGVVLSFPRQGRRGPGDRREQAEVDRTSREARVRLDTVWREATLYARLDSTRLAAGGDPLPYQPEMLALLPVVR
ncbi:MAG TPA: amidohydrolase, partial [Rubricoccaceae bacterium]